jgi:hypothetical protein
MAYLQAPIEIDMYMELPTGIHTKHGNSKDHVLKLLANIYGQKQAGHVWNNDLITKTLKDQLQAVSHQPLCFQLG